MIPNIRTNFCPNCEAQANTIEELRAANEKWAIAFKLAEERATGRIEALLADNARLSEAIVVLRLGLLGVIDSDDAGSIAWAKHYGEAIDWDQYPEATRAALQERDA